MIGTILEFLSKPPDMYVERPRIAEIIIAPDVVQELLSRRNSAGVVDHVRKQRKFLSGQLNFRARADHPHIAKVYGQFLVLILWHRVLFNPSKHGPYAGYDFLGRKGFYYVIVCADIESRDLVGLGRFRRKHYDRDLFGRLFSSQPPAQFEPRHSRKHQIEQDE